MNLSKAQVSLYWKAFAAACQNLGITDKAECPESIIPVLLATNFPVYCDTINKKEIKVVANAA